MGLAPVVSYLPILAVAIGMIPQFIRLARAQALSVGAVPCIEAAQDLGVPDWGIVLRHIASGRCWCRPASIWAGPSCRQSVWGLVWAHSHPWPSGVQMWPPTPLPAREPLGSAGTRRGDPAHGDCHEPYGRALVDWLNPRSRRAR